MRPINKRNFGATAGRLAVSFYDGSSVRTGWVLAQVGTVRYKITDGTTTKIATLCQTTDQLTALTAGTGPAAGMRANLCTIAITPHGGSAENVRKLTQNQAFTVQGSFITWKLGVASTGAGQGTIALVSNATPTVANAIPNQTVVEGQTWTYVVPANTFADLNGDTLTYSASMANNAALVAGITFDAATRTFTGVNTLPPSILALRVTVSDGTATATDTFDLEITEA